MAKRTNNLILFTNQFTIFAFQSQGQNGVVPPPPTPTDEFTVSGIGVQDIFPVITGVVYTYAPVTKRTN